MTPSAIILSEILDWLPTALCVAVALACLYAWKWRR